MGSTGRSNSLAGIKSEIATNYRQVSVPIRDKWGDQFDTHTGYANANGDLYSVEQNGNSFTVNMGDTQRGFVAANSGLTEQEAWERLRRYLSGNNR